MERIQAQQADLPASPQCDPGNGVRAAIDMGESLVGIAESWGEAPLEARRDMIWSLLDLGGLVYDLECQAILGLLLRAGALPALALGLARELGRALGRIMDMRRIAQCAYGPPRS